MSIRSRDDRSDWWARERPTWPHHEASSFVHAAGIRWHVQRMGRGPPLVLVHGTGASTHSWRGIMPLLGQRYSVLSMDLPGHAFTESLSSTRSSIEGIAEAMAELFRTLAIDPVFCVGHSAGAVILCRLALDRRINPRGIISVNGAFVPLGGAASAFFAPLARVLAEYPAVARLVAPRFDRSRAAVARLIARTGSTLDEEGVDLYVRLVRESRHVAGALRMMGNWHLHEFQKSLPSLDVPITLMAGSNDLMVAPRQACFVQKMVPRASVRRLEGLGHLAHEERPALVADEVTAISESA